jgi:DNA-3-methyladenine glycosylase
MASWSTSSSKPGWADSEPLSQAFYARDTLAVARDLLGKVLVTRTRAGETAGRIVETEAYHGTDPASHSCRGETERCAPMFGEPGRAYVYFIYGMHEMLNFVTEPEGYPGAVLIRALEPLSGEALMRRRRGKARETDLTNGPGRLCQALGIRLSHNRGTLQGPSLFVYDDGWRPGRISVSGRVGIRSGTELPWRFFVAGNRWVSRAPQNARAREVAA